MVFHISNIIDIQSKVCKSVFSCRSFLLLLVQGSPNPVRHCRVAHPPRAGHFHSKKLKIGSTEVPQNMGPADGLTRKKPRSPCKVGRAQGGWGANMTWYDVGWGLLVLVGPAGWRQSLGSTSQPQAVDSEQAYQDFIPPFTLVEAQPSFPSCKRGMRTNVWGGGDQRNWEKHLPK